MSWIMEGVWGRRGQFSTVIVYQTADPKRYEQFLQFCRNLKNTNKANKLYVYYIWRGLHIVDFSGGVISLRPVTAQASASLPVPLPASTTPAIKSLDHALDYMEQQFRTEENIWFIIYGVFQRNDTLTAALRAWTFDTEIYDRGHTIVVFTENPTTLFDEETLRYFNYVKVPTSTEEERKELLGNILKEANLKAKINGLVHATSGLNLHEVESIALKSIYRYGKLKAEALFEYKTEVIKKSGILDIEEPKHGFEAVGGYDVLKSFIHDNVIKILQNPKKAEKLGLRPPRGLLLFGVGGSGKTWFAQSLAKELGLPFLRLRTENIVSRYYGETERSMARALELAEEVSPCVLFIDEIDRFGQRGQLGEHEATRRTFSILLEWLGDSKRKTIVIGTTNVPEQLDEAFIRVGRFDYIIPMLFPDLEARKQILKVHTNVIRKVPLDKDVELNEVAEKTDFFTGAELEELILRAARNALKNDRTKVCFEDFDTALNTFKINLDLRKEQMKRYLELAERFCNDAEFLQNLKNSYGSSSRLEILKRELES